VKVGNEIEAVVFRLELEVLTHGPEIVANVKPTGRLYARQNSQD